MLRQVVTCDHCNAEVQGEPFYATPLGKAFSLSQGSVHACSKEHLGLALAKAFGVPVDATTLSLVAQKNEALEAAREAIIKHDALRGDYKSAMDTIKDLEAHTATLTGLANQYKADRDSLEETCRMHSARVVELEKRPSAVDVLQALKARVADITEENNGFRAEPLLDKTLVLLAIEDAIASITDTTKPTKPAMAVEEPEARLEVKQTKWVCVEEGRADAMREAWQKAISNGDNARVIFADGSQES